MKTKPACRSTRSLLMSGSQDSGVKKAKGVCPFQKFALLLHPITNQIFYAVQTYCSIEIKTTYQ